MDATQSDGTEMMTKNSSELDLCVGVDNADEIHQRSFMIGGRPTQFGCGVEDNASVCVCVRCFCVILGWSLLGFELFFKKKKTQT